MLDLADLTAWRETLMIHARGLFSRKGAKNAKEFLRNAGLGGLSGLARDGSRKRFFVLAKAQRAQRNSYGRLDLADLAAWREIIQARDLVAELRKD